MGYTQLNPLTLDNLILGAYRSAGGGTPYAWWNIGATYRSINEDNDEFGGPCRNTATAFVHYCGTNFGNGFLVVQNYIDWLNVRHSILYNMTGGGYVTAGHVKGAIQGALSNSYGGAGAISQIMGTPTGVESNGRQNFQGGYIQITLPGVRAEVYRCDPVCWLAGVTHYAGDGTFCPSVNGDGFVDLSDVAAVDAHAGTSNPEYDINIDGTVNAADHDLVVSRLSTQPCPGDRDGDGLPDGAETGIYHTDPDRADTDGDGCGDGRELGPNHVSGGQRDPLSSWDFFDVPVPYSPTYTTVGLNKAINSSDVLAVRDATGTVQGGPGYNAQYDRTPSSDPSKPWLAGPPNGAVSGQDVLVAQASTGDSCR